MDALQAEGLNYQVAAQVENIDIEMPMFTDTGITDVRLTDYDVVLSRSDVTISRAASVNYTNALTIEMLGLEIQRGYTAVDATVAGVTYRFVNTHLEAFAEDNRIAQAQELVDILSDETLPIILLGDFNTRAPRRHRLPNPAVGRIYGYLADGFGGHWQYLLSRRRHPE